MPTARNGEHAEKKNQSPPPPIDEDDNEDVAASPSVGKILAFAGPAIGVWLCNPLLSLIDTSFVGLLTGTTQQAAMHPAVSVTDYSALLIAFLYTGTTNRMATAREQDKSMHLEEGGGDSGGGTTSSTAHRWPTARRTFRGAMKLSILVGACLGLALLIFAPQLLTLLVGSNNESVVSSVVFDVAVRFVRVRALGMPAAAAIGSAQAACLGMQDIWSPLYVLLAAAVVNVLADCLWVRMSHPWFGGAAGSAWSTVVSQYVALYLFVRWLCDDVDGKKWSYAQRRWKFSNTVPFKSLLFWKKRAGAENGIYIAKQKKPDDQQLFSVRGFLHGKQFGVRSLFTIPPTETFREYKPFVLPVTVTQIGRISGYIAMSHAVSSSMGTVSMAAQQVVVSLFYCLCPIADSLSLTAQSFVPSLVEKSPSVARSKALRLTITNFLKAGTIFGVIISAAVLVIPPLSSLFTRDASVVNLVRIIAYPLLVAWFAVHGIVCATEGILLGQRDLHFLGFMYGLYFFVVPYAILQVKEHSFVALASQDDDDAPRRHPLVSLWGVFLIYQLSRFSAWLVRVIYLQRQMERGAAQLGHYD